MISRLLKQLEVNIKSRLIVQNGQKTVAYLRGALGMRPPPTIAPIFSISCSFRGNGQNNRFAPLPLGLAPPLENPRSAHKNIVKYRKFGQK